LGGIRVKPQCAAQRSSFLTIGHLFLDRREIQNIIVEKHSRDPHKELIDLHSILNGRWQMDYRRGGREAQEFIARMRSSRKKNPLLMYTDDAPLPLLESFTAILCSEGQDDLNNGIQVSFEMLVATDVWGNSLSDEFDDLARFGDIASAFTFAPSNLLLQVLAFSIRRDCGAFQRFLSALLVNVAPSEYEGAATTVHRSIILYRILCALRHVPKGSRPICLSR
jgi:hypothetical protein